MADPSQDQDKSEPATPFKLEEGRRKGQVFKSPELNSLAVLCAALIILLAFADWAIHRYFALSTRVFNESARATLTLDYVLGMARWSGEQLLILLAPLMGLVAVIAIAVNILQTGPVFSFAPIKPDFRRLNPVEGLKRIFSMRSLYEALKAALKLLMLGGVTYAVIDYLMGKLFGLMRMSVSGYPEILKNATAFILFVLILGFLVLALADFTYSRWEFMKKMRMSRRELRDEIKRREGDPQIRAKRRELERELRKRKRSIGRIKDADVLITNPTHVAVALRYRQQEAPAPVVVAKGAGELALQMRRMAYHHGIAVVEAPELARQIFGDIEIDQMIGEENYEEVAAIFRRVLPHRTGGAQS